MHLAVNIPLKFGHDFPIEKFLAKTWSVNSTCHICFTAGTLPGKILEMFAVVSSALYDSDCCQ